MTQEAVSWAMGNRKPSDTASIKTVCLEGEQPWTRPPLGREEKKVLLKLKSQQISGHIQQWTNYHWGSSAHQARDFEFTLTGPSSQAATKWFKNICVSCQHKETFLRDCKQIYIVTGIKSWPHPHAKQKEILTSMSPLCPLPHCFHCQESEQIESLSWSLVCKD